jgi:hypothetical protein
LAQLGEPAGPEDAPALEEIDRRLMRELLDDEEWDVLYRRRLQVVAAAAGTDIDAPEAAANIAPPVDRSTKPALPRLGTVLGVATAALMVIDIVLLATRNPESRA